MLTVHSLFSLSWDLLSKNFTILFFLCFISIKICNILRMKSACFWSCCSLIWLRISSKICSHSCFWNSRSLLEIWMCKLRIIFKFIFYRVSWFSVEYKTVVFFSWCLWFHKLIHSLFCWRWSIDIMIIGLGFVVLPISFWRYSSSSKRTRKTIRMRVHLSYWRIKVCCWHNMFHRGILWSSSCSWRSHSTT